MRRNRRIWLAGVLSVVLAVGLLLALGGKGTSGPTRPPHHPPRSHHHPAAALKSPLDPDWTGDGRPVTLAFAGDVHFPAGTNLGDRLGADPTTALGPTVPALLSGADLSMVNFESAMTDGSCPDAQPKQFVFYAPTTAIQAFEGAKITLITEANNHGEDCGQPGLQQALAAKTQAGYTILGIGDNVGQAFTPYRTTINGERIAIIAATQVIDSDLQTSWTATATQPGLASAYDVSALVAAVEQARKTADTVVVYLHWGTELDPCPNPDQEPLAQVLVDAGADIVVGTHAHVLLGGGYLGSAYVDYGLGNFAFYDNSPPENAERRPGHHRHRTPHRSGHLAPGGDRGRPAPAAHGVRCDDRAGRMEPGPELHQRRGHGRSVDRDHGERDLPRTAGHGPAALGRQRLRGVDSLRPAPSAEPTAHRQRGGADDREIRTAGDPSRPSSPARCGGRSSPTTASSTSRPTPRPSTPRSGSRAGTATSRPAAHPSARRAPRS